MLEELLQTREKMTPSLTPEKGKANGQRKFIGIFSAEESQVVSKPIERGELDMFKIWFATYQQYRRKTTHVFL